VRLDVQRINHNYVTRMVIFSIFLFKNYRKDENAYFQMILNFVRRKIGHNIDLKIEVGPKLSIQEQRENVIDNLLNDDDIDIMNLVVVKFKTGDKEATIQINLNEEDKYEQYLYS
jgi:hypothetical protein